MTGAVPLTGVTWTKATAPPRAAFEYRAGTADVGFSLGSAVFSALGDAQAHCAALPLCAGMVAPTASANPAGPTNFTFLYNVFYARGGGSSVWVRNAGYGAGESPNVWTADLSGLALQHRVDGLRLPGDGSFGAVKRGIRARYPNAPASELMGAMQVVADKWTQQPMGTNAAFTFSPATPLRNDSTDNYFQTFRIGVGGPCAQRFTPQASYWCSGAPTPSQGGGPGPYQAPVGMTIDNSAESLPHTPYANATGAIVHSWRAGRWFSWAFRVDAAAFNAATNATVFNFSLTEGGNQGSRGGNAGQEFFIENVLDELDAPSEWHFDHEARTLTLWYNGTAAPPTDGSIAVTQLAVLVNSTGTQAAPVVGLQFLGLTFADSAPFFMGPHGTPSGGDWAVSRSGSLFFEGTTGFNITGCLLTRLDGNGVFVSGFARNATIARSEFSWIGETAVAQWGYTEGSPVAGMGFDATAGNQPRGTVVQDNLVHEVGLWTKQNSFYFQR